MGVLSRYPEHLFPIAKGPDKRKGQRGGWPDPVLWCCGLAQLEYSRIPVFEHGVR